MDAGLGDMERVVELQVKGHLREIENIDEEVIENGQGRPPAMDGYRRTLESVAECAGPEMVGEVADEIKNRIKTSESRPANHKIRTYAAKRVAADGIAPDEYLLRA